MVKPGGIVVFATCSLLPLEGEARIDAALSSGLGLAREPVTPELIGGDLGVLINRRGELRTLPCHLTDQGGMDGFFAARLRRMA
jgi:16S rRNA (cytosine967-C5)-methyltransferase